MPARLFHAIVLCGSALGAGCKTQPWELGDASVVARDARVPLVDAAVGPDLTSCPCPVQCPNADMTFCGGNCSDGCSTCGACGSKPPAAANTKAMPLEFRSRQ